MIFRELFIWYIKIIKNCDKSSELSVKVFKEWLEMVYRWL